MEKEQIQKELIAILEQSGDVKTKIIDKQSEMIAFLKSHIKNLGSLLEEYEQITNKILTKKI